MHKHTPRISSFFMLILISALLVACGSNTADPTSSVEQAVEQTMEAIEASQPTAEQTAAASYPLPEICDPIAALLDQHLIGVTISTSAENFNDEASGLTGAGCTVLGEGDGATVIDWGQTNSNFMMAMEAAGWQMDPNFSGGGAGGLLNTYRLNGYVCRYIIEVRPSDMSLCDANQPLTVCLDAIAPEQRLYAVTVSCSVDFVILALDSTNAGEQAFYPRPLVVPAEFEPVLQTLTDTGVPVILPDTSLMAAGQLMIYPYILTSRAGLYEISLDYTSDCLGAGACHFGSLAGMWVGPDATTLTSTDSFIYEADRAVVVQLDKGITGYFVEGLCGASCDDSKIFWLFGGYQFMVGGKAADQPGLVDLANAFINNSIR